MAKRSIESRLEVVEHQLIAAKGAIEEIYIRGGIDLGVRAHIVGSQRFEGEPGEDFLSLRDRVRGVAEAEGAKFIIYGGLPPPPADWKTPPDVEEALAKTAWRGADEMDS